jgi:hypothetical protein
MRKFSLSEVFNESVIPEITFVEPREFDDLVGSLMTDGKHVTLCGPSGCGKTTLAKKALARADIGSAKLHWMSGRDHTTARSWEAVFAGEFGCGEEEVLEWMLAAGLIVVDDFHHLGRDVRDAVGRHLKRWNERGIRVFVIGIAETSYHLLNLDTELGIRIDAYDMKTQNDEFIGHVVGKGERALNITFEERTKAQFKAASKGIPSAIQAICRIACLRSGIHGTLDEQRDIAPTMEDVRDGVLRIYRGKYQNKIVGLAKGKQQARSVHNTYFEIIKNICLLDKSEVSVEELRSRIVGTATEPKERGKKNTSFYNCLNNLESVILQRGLADAIYFEPTSRTISIEDPSFRLYLSLIDIEELEKAVRVRKTTFPWDVAVSFSGTQRATVERLRDLLNEAGYTCFYDFDQQHILWGQNLRTKLADVYANEAEYMVVLLSKDYPEKDWPAFELDVGKNARRKRTKEYLLPIKVDDVVVVGLSSDIGYMDLRSNSIDEIASKLILKIESPGDVERSD